MDFLWVSNIPNTRKQKSTCSSPDVISTPSNDNEVYDIIHNSEKLPQLKERNSGSRLSYTPSSTIVNGPRTNNEFIPTSSRRSRADTMPTSTICPFPNLGNPSNLYNSISNVAQQRPNNERSDSLGTPLEDMSLYHSSGMSSPLDENATNSIASTLASLGLNEDGTVEESLTDTKMNNRKTSYFESPLTRHRSFTVSSQMTENQQNNKDMMSFNPFAPPAKPTDVLPTTVSANDGTIRRRPRAISVGIADLHPSIQQQHNSFAPFQPSYQQHGNTNIDLTESNNLPLLYQTRNLFTHMDSHEEEENNNMDVRNMIPSRLSSPGLDMEPPAQTPSRALWLGNVNPSISVPDLHKMFARYGHVESARILSDKECAFVNFETVESALAAKEDLVNRLGCKVGGTVVKVGFGKADVDVAMALTNEAGPNAQGPTRALWVGNIPANINPAVLRSIFQSYGNIELIRILSHKNCGFVNFERQEDAVRARKMLQNKEILGPGTGTVRIGFAKAPVNNPDEIVQDVVISDNTITSYPAPVIPSSSSTSSSSITPQQIQEKLNTDANASTTTQWATVLLMASMMMNATAAKQQQKEGDAISTPVNSNTPSPSSSTQLNSNYQRLASERKLIMQQLGYESKSDEVERIPIKYFSSIPPVLEFGPDRTLGPLRLREIRKSLDNGNAIPNIEQIAQECMVEIVELCSDYIGNTVVQKLFEYCCEETKLAMIEKISPYLASIGVHKNGTWAAQKIIETARTDQQIQLICWNVAPYVPLLLLDQFGNYVVQCCLRMGSKRNQYIFDAIVDNCWEIGQGRFGARAVRAILENPIVTKEQQVYVATSIMQNALLLTTNVNGSILLNWLLETSGLLGQFRTLCNTNSSNTAQDSFPHST